MTSYFVYASVLVSRWWHGLKWQSVTIGLDTFVYLDSAPNDTSKPIALFLHGFGGEKDNWTQVVTPLIASQKVRVVLLDVLAFGESSKRPHVDYGLTAQAARVKEFMDVVFGALSKVHLVGFSMGGGIALLFALAHQRDRLLSLSLLAPAGLVVSTKTEFDRMWESGSTPLVITSIEDVDRLMGLISFKPPQLPHFIKQFLVDRAAPNVELHRAVGARIRQEVSPALINERLHELTVPLLVVWGRADRVLHFSGADLIAAAQPKTRVVILDDCGHAPVLEKAAECTSALSQFWNDVAAAKADGARTTTTIH
jgi:abhydrolase domain-containing protein 6